MSYLLSDGTVSTNWKDAIIDALMIRIQIAPSSVPWYGKGMDKVVLSIKKKEIEETMLKRIQVIAEGVNNDFNCNLTVSELTLNPDGTYSLRIKLNDYEREIYSNYRTGDTSYLQ